jgi:ankyrin repeat protein
LVEPSTRNAYENEYEDPALPNTADRILSPTDSDIMSALSIWRISLYVASDQQSRDFFDLVSKGTPSQVQAAIQAGADLGQRDKDGATPLMIACRYNQNAEVVSVLLLAGADGKAKDNRGLEAIDYAADNAALKESDAYRQLQKASQ